MRETGDTIKEKEVVEDGYNSPCEANQVMERAEEDKEEKDDDAMLVATDNENDKLLTISGNEVWTPEDDKAEESKGSAIKLSSVCSIDISESDNDNQDL